LTKATVSTLRRSCAKGIDSWASQGGKLEILDRELIQLFPTCLFAGKVSDITICDRLEMSLRALKERGEGISEATFYVTPDDLQTRPEMKEFSDLVLKEAKEVLDVLSVKRDSHYITNMWANITNPNHRHAMHIHPNCLLSGIMYVKAPKDCGPTQFADPRPGARMIEPSFTQMNKFNMGQFVVAPELGRLLIWPSFMPHAVERGHAQSVEDRIVIAFNIMIRGTIESRTARLVLK
jgi:uncharacterized protein (TIGR02466 family)